MNRKAGSTSAERAGSSGGSTAAVVVILVTGPDAEGLRAMGRTLVEERLTACVNVIDGVGSVFRWEGRIEEAAEALAILKTTPGRVRELEKRVLALHPYDEPEFLALPVRSGSAGYMEWITRSVDRIEDESETSQEGP